MGDVIVLPTANFWPTRAATLGAIIIIILGVVARKLAAASRHRVIRQAAGWLLILAFALTVAVALTVTGALTVAGAFTVALALAVTVALTVAGAFAVTVEILDSRGKPQLARWLVTLTLPLGWIVLLITLPWADISEQYRGIFLFLGVFPLINALFDVVSYAVTLTLLRLGLAGRHPFLNGAIDLAIAMVLFLALGACLTALITAMNALAGTPLFDLDALFDGM